MTQGERIRKIRKELKLTLEKFGEKLGVKKSAISDLESGRNSLTDQMIKSICREYNVSYDYLIYGDGEMFTNLPATIVDELCVQFDLDDFDRAIVEMYIELSPDEKAVVKKMMQEFAKKVGLEST